MSRHAARRAGVALALLAAVLAVGCRRPPTPRPAGGPTKVVATIYPLCDWARQIGGEQVEASVLVPPGISPHAFEPTQTTARMVAEAEVVLQVGLEYDEWMDRLIASGGGGANVLRLGTVSRLELIADGGVINPHVWLDPVRAQVMVGAIRDVLARADPEHAETYAENARRYEEELVALAAEILNQTEPYRGRSVITFHDAYHYLLDRCGIGLTGVIQPFPGKEPSAAHLQRIVSRARELGQRVILADAQLSPKAAQIIAQEIGGRVAILDPLGDPDDPARDTYLELVRHNVKQIVQALGPPASQ